MKINESGRSVVAAADTMAVVTAITAAAITKIQAMITARPTWKVLCNLLKIAPASAAREIVM